MVKDYQQGKIYIIRNSVNDKVYIGSTCKPRLCQRMVIHRSCMQRLLNGTYKKMAEIGIESHYIELIELYPCDSVDELRAREGHWQRQYKETMWNRKIEGRTMKEYTHEYNEANREQIKEKAKEYYEANLEQIREKAKERMHKYREANPKTIYESRHKHLEANRERINKQKREQYEANRDRVLVKNNTKVSCPHCQMEMNRSSLSRHIKTKHAETLIQP